MPPVTLAVTDIDRKYGKLPHFHLTNGFIEEDKTNGVTGTAWLQRPGLIDPQVLGVSTPIRMVWGQVGTFDDDWLVIAGSTLYRVTRQRIATVIGSIPTSDYPVAAGGVDSVIIVSNGVAYRYDGAALTTIVMPDDRQVSSVAYINGYFILPVINTQTFYWIVPGGVNPDALDFASAERAADNIVSVQVQSDTIVFLKETNEEYWFTTGSADAPFQRVNGRVSNYGCISRNSVAMCGPALVWVSAEYQIVASDGVPQVLSTPSQTEALRQSVNFRAWYYMLDSHPFYIVTTDTVTFACDLSTGSSARYNSYERTAWRAHLGVQISGSILAGDSETGTIWTLSPDASSDDGDAVAREVTGFIQNVGEPISCDSLSLCMDVGWSPTPGFEPQFQMRFSDNQGNTWSSWKQKSLGDQGYYGKELEFRSLGLMLRPGRLFHFRMTDDARYRLSYVRVNEV